MIMLAGLALGAVGSIMGSAAQGAQAKAQAAQAEMNRQLQEFEKQYNLEQQRGAMGLAEMQKILSQGQGQKESLAAMLAQKRASRDQEQYASNQFSRSFRQNKARAQMTMTSRGTGRGGTADAVQSQLDRDAAADSGRIRVNFSNQRDSFENSRNAAMQSLFSGGATAKPPTYFPSSPIPMPDTSGQLMGSILSSIGGVVGGAMGAAGATQGTTPTGNVNMGPQLPANVANPFPSISMNGG
tara:strand:+ start:810 stop:1532 length:723 start_codon:yes stop_codon:yes gene_type:complete